MDDTQAQRPLTFGEKVVGISFNPSNDPIVDEIKRGYADLIDKLDRIRNDAKAGWGEQERLASIAITQAEDAQMWAVKAATWRD